MPDESFQRVVKMGRHSVVNFGRPVILAEIGALFNQDIDAAAKLIQRIADVQLANPHIPIMLKSEFILSKDMCLDDDSIETYQSRTGERASERFHDLISRKVLSKETYATLIKLATERNLDCVVSVYDVEGIELAKKTGVDALKIAASNVNHIPLIREASASGLPVIIDTGRATLAEVDRAITTTRRSEAQAVVLQHSPDGHPAPDRNHNLNSINTLRTAFDLQVGFSCHASDDDACVSAVALGAAFIEKNLSPDPTSLEQDTAFSIGVDELETFVLRISRAYDRMGDSWRDAANQSGLIATSARMGLVAKRDLVAGELCDADSVGFAFPNKGVSVCEFDRVLGWRLSTDRKKGTPIDWQDLVPQ